jgi:hypothetical protein
MEEDGVLSAGEGVSASPKLVAALAEEDAVKLMARLEDSTAREGAERATANGEDESSAGRSKAD